MDNVTVNPIKKFFLVCSGATLDILLRPDCKTEQARYAMMGAFVALTAAFAALSGGYALYAGFKTPYLAVPVGLLWGAFIFTLDRFIISSIRKRRIDPDLPAGSKALIKLQEVGAAVPRLLLATFIAITVAVPLEMKYFESEIKAKLSDNNLQAAPRLANLALEGFPEIRTRERELAALTAREEELTRRRDLLRDQLRMEVDGVEGEGLTGRAGDGPQAAVRREEYRQVEGELQKILKENEPEKAKLRGMLDELRANARRAGDRAVGDMEEGNGFLAQFRALRELAADGPVRDLTLFLVVLLTLIETTPVVIKLFAGRGPYDDVLEMVEYKVYVNQQKEISNFNSDVNTDLEIYRTKCEARRQREERQLHRDEHLRNDGWEDDARSSRREPDAGHDRGGRQWSWEPETAAMD